MKLEQFIFSFFGLMVLTSLVIMGWYAITRGRVEYSANGGSYLTGKIFKGWHFFWTQAKSFTQSQLMGDALIQAVVKMQTDNDIPRALRLTANDKLTKITFDPTGKDMINHYRFLIKKVTGANLIFTGPNEFILKRVETQYRFSELLRDPMSECPTCMASVYGTAIYFLVQFFSNGHMFQWASWKLPAVYCFWPLFCIGCAYLNTILAKKL